MIDGIKDIIEGANEQKRKLMQQKNAIFNSAMSNPNLNDEQRQKLREIKQITNRIENSTDPKEVNELIAQLNENQ